MPKKTKSPSKNRKKIYEPAYSFPSIEIREEVIEQLIQRDLEEIKEKANDLRHWLYTGLLGYSNWTDKDLKEAFIGFSREFEFEALCQNHLKKKTEGSMSKMVVQVLKNVAGRMSFVAVTEPLPLTKAQKYQKDFEKRYPDNTYRLVGENEEV